MHSPGPPSKLNGMLSHDPALSDVPLRALVSSPDASIERIALGIARDEFPRLDVAASLAQLDDLAAPVAQRVARARTASAQAGVLGTYLHDECGFRGNEDDYYDPRNSYLNLVLERRLGIPITLAVVLIAVGRRLGLAIDGVGFPGHFLVRLGGDDGIFLDPFFRVRILSRPALENLARRALGHGAALRPEYLAPVGAHAFAIRMLTNLKAIYEARRDHARAMVVCDRIVDIADVPENRRDRGRNALALGALAAAADDLEHYLAQRSDAHDAEPLREALARARARGGPALQ